MPSNHEPASHAFSSALVRILQRTESMLQRRLDGGWRAPEEPEPEDMLAGLEVQDSDWGSWVEAGGDLLMGNGERA